MSGYHVEWNKSQSSSNDKKPKGNKKVINENHGYELAQNREKEDEASEIQPIESIETETSKDIVSLENTINVTTNTFEEKYFSEPCDNVIMKDGQEISAKVLEITDDIVKIKKCENLNGPTYKIDKSSILMIRYANGTKDIFNTNITEKPIEKESTKKTEILSLLSLVFSIVGIIMILFLSILGGGLLSLLALILGIVGHSKISKNPQRYTGRGFAIAGIILGVIGLTMTFIFMSMIYAALA